MVNLTWCVLLVCCVVGSWGQSERGLPHTSPCPDVYGYGWEPVGGWHGLVTILPPAMYSEAQLVFRMTVPYYRPEAGVGQVEIKGGTAEVQAISRRAFRGERHKIQFMIIFPPFDQVPRVKQIIINGKTFCSDLQAYPDTRSTIELKYVLRTGLRLPVASGNDFSVVASTPTSPANNNYRPPSKPDLVTVAILVPLDEARPMVSSPQAPTQPIGSGLQSQRPVGSGSQPSHPMAFAPQRPSQPIGANTHPPHLTGSGIQMGQSMGINAQSPRPIGSSGQSPYPVGTGAHPIGSDNQSPYPVEDGSQSPSHPDTHNDISTTKKPCKCNKTSSQNEISGGSKFPSHEAPKHHVFHAFNPPNSNVQINIENINDLYDIFTTTMSGIQSGGSSGHDTNNGNSFVGTPMSPTTSDSHSGVSGQNSNSNGNLHHVLTDTSHTQRPGASSGDSIHYNENVNAPSTKKPTVGLSNHKKPVDDKIYFIMTDSDEVNSPRIVKLLEHLLVIAKKHYQIDLERLQIEKKRLTLEQSPHFTLVV